MTKGTALSHIRGALQTRYRKMRQDAELKTFQAVMNDSPLAQSSAPPLEEDSVEPSEEKPSGFELWQPRWKIVPSKVGPQPLAVYDNPLPGCAPFEKGEGETGDEAPLSLRRGSFLLFLEPSEPVRQTQLRSERLRSFLSSPVEERIKSPAEKEHSWGEHSRTSPDIRTKESSTTAEESQDSWSCLFSPVSSNSSSFRNPKSAKEFENPKSQAAGSSQGEAGPPASSQGVTLSIQLPQAGGVKGEARGGDEPWDPWLAVFSPPAQTIRSRRSTPQKSRVTIIKKNLPPNRNPSFNKDSLVQSSPETQVRQSDTCASFRFLNGLECVKRMCNSILMVGLEGGAHCLSPLT
jgi:hypothetical protein